jgi:hypothetical protein
MKQVSSITPVLLTAFQKATFSQSPPAVTNAYIEFSLFLHTQVQQTCLKMARKTNLAFKSAVFLAMIIL